MVLEISKQKLIEYNQWFVNQSREIIVDMDKLPYVKRNYDFEKVNWINQRIDIDCRLKDGTALYVIDIDYKKENWQNDLEISLKVTKEINKEVKGLIKFSGNKGFHIISKIKYSERLVQFLLENNIEKIYDFFAGITNGIINKKFIIYNNEKIFFSEFVDFQIYNRDYTIRSFCINRKRRYREQFFYSIPVEENDTINDILLKSLFKIECNFLKEIPEFNLELLNKYKFYQKTKQKKNKVKRKIEWKIIEDFDITKDKRYELFPKIIKNIIKRNEWGFEERKEWVMFANGLGFTPSEIISTIKNIKKRNHALYEEKSIIKLLENDYKKNYFKYIIKDKF